MAAAVNCFEIEATWKRVAYEALDAEQARIREEKRRAKEGEAGAQESPDDEPR